MFDILTNICQEFKRLDFEFQSFFFKCSFNYLKFLKFHLIAFMLL